MGWTVNGCHVGKAFEDTAAMSLVLDTMLTALEGRNGEYSTFMHHQVDELELEKNIGTPLEGGHDVHNISESAIYSKHLATCTSPAQAMREQLNTFMSAYPTLFQIGGSPMGKITAYMQQKKGLVERLEKSHAADRLANMSEVQYETLMGAFKSKCKRK